jgi:hypothetical protein
MQISKLIALAVALAIASAATGQLANTVRLVQRAQVALLRHSTGRVWGHAWMLPTR